MFLLTNLLLISRSLIPRYHQQTTKTTLLPTIIRFSHHSSSNDGNNNLEYPSSNNTSFTSSPPTSPSAPTTPPYKSRSTANPSAEAQFTKGSKERKTRLHAALHQLGIDPTSFTNDPEYRGSAALRMYTSFLLPKSKGALAMAEAPQRASVIANSIAFMIREHKSHQEEWLRNHDRSLKEVNDLKMGRRRTPLTIVLDNIRSAYNVGNIIRAAEAARLECVNLCGITPSPPNPKVLKTALGAAEYVPYKTGISTLESIRKLKSQGVTVWGVETTSKSKSLWKIMKEVGPPPQPLALVFGNELVGVDADVLKECDELVCIPTLGVKNSLNVATCASVLIWEALRQWDEEVDDDEDEVEGED